MPEEADTDHQAIPHPEDTETTGDDHSQFFIGVLDQYSCNIFHKQDKEICDTAHVIGNSNHIFLFCAFMFLTMLSISLF